MPSIIDYFSVTEAIDSGCRWTVYELDLSSAQDISILAEEIAKTIVKIRCGDATNHYDWWVGKASGQLKLTELQSKILCSFLLPSIGTRDNPSPDDQIQAVIAESLWYSIILARELDDEILVRIEDPHFTVTEPGGDGLAVYQKNDDTFFFRLWEMKKHNQLATATSKITEASSQLKDNGAEYLAKWSKIDQEVDYTIPGLSKYYAQLVEKWITSSSDTNSGISLTKNTASFITDTPVTKAKEILTTHTEINQVEVMIIKFDDLNELGNKVRKVIWNGI
jgi:hypothetical protein